MQDRYKDVGKGLTIHASTLCESLKEDITTFEETKRDKYMIRVETIIDLAVRLYIQNIFMHYTENEKLDTEKTLVNSIGLMDVEG